MATYTVKPTRVLLHDDGSLQIDFMSPFADRDGRPPGTEHLPVAHVIHPSTYYHRAITHELDNTSPTFVQDVVRLALHAAHTPGPSSVRSNLAAADKVMDWQFDAAAQQVFQKVHTNVVRHDQIERTRAQLRRQAQRHTSAVQLTGGSNG